MTYQELDNLLGLTNLTDFVNQLTTESTLRCEKCTTFYELHTDPLIAFRNWERAANYCTGTFFDKLACKIWCYIFGVRDAIKAIWNDLYEFFFKHGSGWFFHIWNTLKGLMYDVSAGIKEFFRDPWGYLYRVIQTAVTPLINGIKSVSINIWDLAQKLWLTMSGYLSPLFDSVKNTILNWITDRVNAISSWIDKVKTTISNFWEDISLKISNIYNKVKTVVSNALFSISDQIRNGVSTVLKTIDFGLGGLADALYKAFSGIFGKFWDWFKEITIKAWNFVNVNLLEPLAESAQTIWNWLLDLMWKIFNKIKGVAMGMLPRAPEEGESMIMEALGFLGLGGGVLAAMTLGGGLAKRISGADIPGLGAIVADLSSFRYITAAVMGGLVFAAYTQPLKYFYNSIFRPYLPEWRDIKEMYDRSIITEDEFKFYMKYHGLPDKYAFHYHQISDRPIPEFMVGQMAAWDIFSPGEILEEMRFYGFWEEGTKRMLPMLWWKAKEPFLTRLLTAMMYSIRRGIATVEEMMKDLQALKAKKVRVDSSGHRRLFPVSWEFRALPTDAEITEMIGKWESKRLAADAMIDSIKVQYQEDLITEKEARTELAKYIKIPELIDAEIAPIKYRKVKQTEPKKGKNLRDELKTVLRRAYQYGYITHKFLQQKIKDTNQVVDEETLIKERANWEAFIDDMRDWEAIYRENLENGIITEAEFRKDLIDLGFRPSKVELFIRYDKAKKLGRVPKEREELESKLKDLELRLKDLASDLKAVEEDLAVETEPEKITRLTRRKTEITEDIEKTESEIDLIKARLAALPA